MQEFASLLNRLSKKKGDLAAIEQPFGFPKEHFSEQFLTCENFFNNLKNLFVHFKEPLVEWKGSRDIKVSSWNASKEPLFFKSVPFQTVRQLCWVMGLAFLMNVWAFLMNKIFNESKSSHLQAPLKFTEALWFGNTALDIDVVLTYRGYNGTGVEINKNALELRLCLFGI